MKVLEIKSLSKRYSKKNALALNNFSLEVYKGEIVALLGESGSGKTTLLRLIAGFEEPLDGEIIINGDKVVGKNILKAPEKRHIGMVFQNYALFPHLNIAENLSFGLNKWNSKERKERVAEMLQLVGLNGLDQRFPHQLSGGQQQRVALARALAPKPSLILLDEPFSNLDTLLKEQVREDIRKIIKQTGTTAIFVTHDTKDALSTADRVAILKEGIMQQIGTPEEVFNRPANFYVANFFGKVNVLEGTPINGGFNTPIGFIPCTFGNSETSSARLIIRPENILICEEEDFNIKGKIASIIYLGDQKQLNLVCGSHNSVHLFMKVDNDLNLDKGTVLHLKIKEDKIQVIDF